MLQLPLLLLRLIARQPSKSTTNSTSNTVANALAEIADLALRLLALAVGVLLLTSFAQALKTKSTADGFFAGADGLVPRALLAVGVVRCYALGADGVAADVGAGV